MPTVDITVPMHLRKIKQSNSATNGTNNLIYIYLENKLVKLIDLKDANAEKEAVKELKGLQYLKPNIPNEIESNVKSAANKDKNKGFNFVVMVKKNNKTQYHNMEVPLASEFANQFIAREEVKNFILLVFCYLH